MYPYERFNSWINRQVLNRRFPESMVIETYTLYEIAHFLQPSDQLPTGAMTELSVTDAADPEETEACPPLSTMEVLDDCQLKDLDRHYDSIDTTYHALILRYTEERKLARRQRKLKDFPKLSQRSPKEGPSLTQEEEEMRQGRTSQALNMPSYTSSDKHGRAVQHTSKEADRIGSGCKASFVYLSTRKSEALKETLFGQILFIFQHAFDAPLQYWLMSIGLRNTLLTKNRVSFMQTKSHGQTIALLFLFHNSQNLG